MIDPGEILEALVTKWRLIPDLLTELTPPGDVSLTPEERIYGYHDLFPHQSSLPVAIHKMPAGSVMLVWEGTGIGGGRMEVWRHQFAAYLRLRVHAEEEPTPPTYYRMFRFLTKGVPTGQDQPIINLTVHANCQPMDLPSLARDTDAEGLDYFKVTLTFTEIGDE